MTVEDAVCPKYMCLCAASDPLMLSSAVIFSCGQLLACHVRTEIYPHQGPVHVHSHAHYVRMSSFFYNVPVVAQHMLHPSSPRFTSELMIISSL